MSIDKDPAETSEASAGEETARRTEELDRGAGGAPTSGGISVVSVHRAFGLMSPEAELCVMIAIFLDSTPSGQPCAPTRNESTPRSVQVRSSRYGSAPAVSDRVAPRQVSWPRRNAGSTAPNGSE